MPLPAVPTLMLAIIAIVALTGTPAQAQLRHDVQSSHDAHSSHGPGRYVNALYGYSLRIPPRLMAFDNAAAPQRGIHLMLAVAPRAFVYVDAHYDTFYDLTAQAVQRRDLDQMHDQRQLLQPPRQMAAALAGAAGRRYIATVRGADTLIYVEDDVVVLRNREIYSLHLRTPQSRYPQDLATFQTVIQSWRWLTPRAALAVPAAPAAKRP